MADQDLRQVMHPRLPLPQDVVAYLARMEASGVYSNQGPLVRELERRHAERLGVDAECVVALASGTAALTSAVATSVATHWRVPAFTFPASAHAVVNAGRVLMLCDVDPQTWQIRAAQLRSGEGLLPVLPFGAPVDMAAWPADAPVVIDAAASLGAVGEGIAGLPPDWCVAFSLGATKMLACGEGGLVVCGNRSRAGEIRSWSHFALDSDRRSTGPGTNAAMPEVSAAYGLASLDRWDADRRLWERARQRAVQHSHHWPGLPHGEGMHPYWIVDFGNGDTARLAEQSLAARGIASRRWWGPGLHRMPAFADHQGGFPVTEHLADSTLGLPFWRDITAEQAAEVGEVLASLSAETDLPGSLRSERG